MNQSNHDELFILRNTKYNRELTRRINHRRSEPFRLQLLLKDEKKKVCLQCQEATTKACWISPDCPARLVSAVNNPMNEYHFIYFWSTVLTSVGIYPKKSDLRPSLGGFFCCVADMDVGV